jgi:hypothetical protein
MGRLIVAFLALIFFQGAAFSDERAQVMVLAGGSLKLCSSLSPGACEEGALAALGTDQRGPAQYRIDDAGLRDALDPALWRGRPGFIRPALAAMLAQLREHAGDAVFDARSLRDRLGALCLAAGEDGSLQAQACDHAARRPWPRLLDAEQDAVLAALEQAQIAGGERRRERAPYLASRESGGVAVIDAFVAEAAVRANGGRPRIAFVTASAVDPFDAVDFYADLLREAGAEPEWWPLDIALRAAVEADDCAALPRLRRERLLLPGRERVYPDLVAVQHAACADADRLRELPARVQGVFFAGGDQWRLRQAFFDDRDRPMPWLLALREAFARGTVVIGGTSAGSAVQAGLAMVNNGTPERALLHGGRAMPPPQPGCARAARCDAEAHEDALGFWPAGGLALWPDLLVDTHFSERARELRLLRLLHDGGARFGIGLDETSALKLVRDGDGDWQAEATGAHGAWLFDAGTPEARCGPVDTALRAQVAYLRSGESMRFGPAGLGPLARAVAAGPGQRPAAKLQPLEPKALRIAMSALGEGQALHATVGEGRRRAAIALRREDGVTWLSAEPIGDMPPACAKP